ncbi:ATP-binding cassette domain-containing protein [Marinihelvus fidelis]|uniref:ATP-binding cassette domain-containing protein n=1 Tax=Marinihelvus fidelis TaxID=2613842 RepID=A0A5N0T509_9GAMM|nr:ATP-binding cassette domain-containing protein [Marinihelvus fidelis]KAA9129868.1 ATP-binding cassette domain-containing protein [Marinihelvus fidelis]
MIEAINLRKEYGGFTAVDDLSFTVEPGQVLGFLGPNGAGKSTTMKMLTGFLAPTAGTARVNGHDIVSDSLAARRAMGYLPEGAPSYGEMTVGAFLDFVGRARGLDNPAHARGAAVERLSLGGVLHQSIETLSKGFKRRVGLAQAILHDPQVLILDEPTDGLDPNQKHEVRRLIEDMASDKIIVISTHILEEVEAVCNRVMVIAHGRLMADDTPAGMVARSRYHNAVTLVLESPKQAASVLSELPEVRKAEIRGAELTVFPAAEGLLPAVSRVIAERGWNVAELRLEAGRFDEVFREITHGEAD